MAPLLAASLISAGGSILGSILGKQKAPQQATYTPVDPQAVQKKAIEGNLQNLGQAQNLASQTNSFNQTQANPLMEQAMPGFGAMQKRLMSSINDDLNSQNSMPQEMQDQISRFAAEKGVTRGTSGNFNGFNLVKDFGFNLTDWKNASRARALNTMSSVFGMTPRVNPMSPMAMMVDPNTAMSVQSQNNQMQYNSQQAGFNAQAAASNYNRSLLGGAIQSAGNFASMATLMGGMNPGSSGGEGIGSKVMNTPVPDASFGGVNSGWNATTYTPSAGVVGGIQGGGYMMAPYTVTSTRR